MAISFRDKSNVGYHPLLIATIVLFYKGSFIAHSLHMSPNLEWPKYRKDLLFSVCPESKR